MARLTLLIGYRASSAGSFQAWLALRQAGLLFDVRTLTDEAAPRPVSTWVGEPPILLVDDVPIWGALSIGEFLAEHVSDLWPSDARARAFARSVAGEVQGGLRSLQALLPFDLSRRFRASRIPRPVQRDLDRIVTLWRACRTEFGAGGPFLFGHFTLADAMHAALAIRLLGHSIPLDAVPAAYVEAIAALPAVVEWVDRAVDEQENRARGQPHGSSNEHETFMAPAPTVREEPRPGPQRIEPSTLEPAVKPIGAGTRRRH